MYRNLVACALALGLTGCSVGISGDGSSPHTEFKAAVNYKDAYDAAIRQANACLRSTDNAYRVVPSLDEGLALGRGPRAGALRRYRDDARERQGRRRQEHRCSHRGLGARAPGTWRRCAP